MNVFYLKGVNQSMKQFIQWLATKNFILVDLMLIASMGVLLYASWPSLQSYSRWTAIALLAIMVMLAVIGLGALVIQVAFMTKRKAIDLRVYEQQQLSLPLPSLPTTKIIEQEQVNAPVQKRLPGRNRSRNVRVLTPRNGQEQGYRPISNALISPVPTAVKSVNVSVPGNGNIIFGKEFQVRTKVFGSREQEHIIALKREGTSNRDICKELRIGNDYYPVVAAIIKAYQEQVGEL